MRKFEESLRMLERAERVIPLGSQTFSKSRTQFPKGVSPHFMVRAVGSRTWDVDGNEYIDFVSGLAAVTLGYQDPDVTLAVERQLRDGVIFSQAHPLETQVAELICEMVPCAEMVRFGKNGSDATAGAVRLARAYTKRNRVAVCGYHGWQDWYIGSTSRNAGVPPATSNLTHSFSYNDLDSLRTLLESHPGEFAAVILEPMNVSFPSQGFLEGVIMMAHDYGALAIFDETITGFRFDNGGAQRLFGVTPDLATFGKGLANGYPLSAVAGRQRVMRLMEDVFFSFTFGGETLSLAAARATLQKLIEAPVTATLAERGNEILAGCRRLIEKHGLSTVLSVSGHPSWTFLAVRDAACAPAYECKTLLMQELHQSGILCLGTHNVSYAHTSGDVAALLAAYDQAFEKISSAIATGGLRHLLRCPPLEPLFKVR